MKYLSVNEIFKEFSIYVTVLSEVCMIKCRGRKKGNVDERGEEARKIKQVKQTNIKSI
jgi:hypothetical protein